MFLGKLRKITIHKFRCNIITDNSFSSKNKKIEWVALNELYLDLENPRIASILDIENGHIAQDELVKLLWREMAVDEIALSIATNNYFSGEPLFVIPRNGSGFIVAEGNRRLAAVKLLTNPQLRQSIKATEINEVRPEVLQSLQTLPVIKYANREELWKYLGFRHINGPKPWDAFSKAKYVSEVHNQYQIPLDEIARMIGDKNATVERLYRGYEVLAQAEQQTDFSREDRIKNKFYFSHLYTAMDYPQFQNFLGISDSKNSLKSNPVPASHLKQLEELVTWLYGKKSAGLEPAIRKQNPDLNILREILEKPESLALFQILFRQGQINALDRAHQVAIGDVQRFSEAIIRAKEELQKASATVSTGYIGEENLLEIAQDIVTTAQALQRTMRQIINRKNR